MKKICQHYYYPIWIGTSIPPLSWKHAYQEFIFIQNSTSSPLLSMQHCKQGIILLNIYFSCRLFKFVWLKHSRSPFPLNLHVGRINCSGVKAAISQRKYKAKPMLLGPIMLKMIWIKYSTFKWKMQSGKPKCSNWLAVIFYYFFSCLVLLPLCNTFKLTAEQGSHGVWKERDELG